MKKIDYNNYIKNTYDIDIKRFNKYNNFKKFIISLNKDDIKNNYYYIELNEIDDLYIEDDIDFNGKLIFNQCNKLKSIKGCFNINSLIINNCKNLLLIDLYSTITKLIINIKRNDNKTFKIIGNYMNLKNIIINKLNNKNSKKIILKKFYFDGEFNKDIIIEGDTINNLFFEKNILNIKNKIENEIILHNIDMIKNINKINNLNCNKCIIFKKCKNIIGDFLKFKEVKIKYINNTNIIGKFNNLNIEYTSHNINIISNVLNDFYFNNNYYNKLNINIFGNYNNIHLNYCKNLNLNCNIIEEIKLKNVNKLKIINCNIKKLTLSWCEEIPKELNNLINLEKLELIRCKNLNYISNKLINLKELIIKNCDNIKEILDNLINLEKLELIECYKLKYIPKELINLKELIIDDRNIKEISDNLINLQKIKLYMCYDLQKIPKELINLKELLIVHCKNIKEIPKNLINLKKLIISSCENIKEIPKELINLEEIELYDNYNKKKYIKKETINKNNYKKLKSFKYNYNNIL